MLAWAEDASGRLSELDVSDEALDALTAARDAARAEVDDLAAQVSAGRRAAADGFAAEVGAELAGLAMKSATVSFSSTAIPTEPGADGIDEVALLLAAHPGCAGPPGAQGRLRR